MHMIWIFNSSFLWFVLQVLAGLIGLAKIFVSLNFLFDVSTDLEIIFCLHVSKWDNELNYRINSLEDMIPAKFYSKTDSLEMMSCKSTLTTLPPLTKSLLIRYRDVRGVFLPMAVHRDGLQLEDLKVHHFNHLRQSAWRTEKHCWLFCTPDSAFRCTIFSESRKIAQCVYTSKNDLQTHRKFYLTLLYRQKNLKITPEILNFLSPILSPSGFVKFIFTRRKSGLKPEFPKI